MSKFNATYQTFVIKTDIKRQNRLYIYRMKIYELFLIYLIAVALGVIIRYILGYRKRHISLATLNVLLGGVACALDHALYGADFFDILFSGLGGVIGNFIYTIIKLIAVMSRQLL